MAPKYNIGQKVIISPNDMQGMSPRDCTIDVYVGQIGNITDYYWISPRDGERFYIYTVKIESGQKDIVLYEDEIEPCTFI